jgi:hypothetical protein
MGRGITRIRDLDGERVNTFIIELHSDFDDVKLDYIRNRHLDLSEEYISGCKTFAEKRRAVLHLYMEGKLPVKVSDERVYDIMSDCDDEEIDNIAFEIAELDGFEHLMKREPMPGRDNGMIIAKSANCLIVIDDNESDFVIGCVPTETWDNMLNNIHNERFDEELWPEAEAELEKTRKRAGASYEIKYNDIMVLADEKAVTIAEKEWDEFYDKKFRPDANAAMRKVHEWMGTRSMRVPTSAWTSATMKAYDEMSDEERNQYY